MYKFSEYVSPGHPDKVADYISEYILDRYMEKDSNVRYAVEVMIKGLSVYLAGEVTSTVSFTNLEIHQFVKNALNEIGYTLEYAQKWGLDHVINSEGITTYTNITAQSPEIGQGVTNDGWGDQGIFFGYADPDEAYMTPRSHSLAKDLCYLLYTNAKDNGIGGIDIKTEIILGEDGGIEKIIAAVPCRDDEEYNKVKESIFCWYDTVGEDSSKRPEIILNGTGNYVMHGPVADCGVTGRKLAVDFYGGEFQVGGGSPWTKDSSKADLTLNLYARKVARDFANSYKVPVKVSLACCIGKNDVNYSVNTPCEDEIESGTLTLKPHDLKYELGLNKPIYTSICKFGLFGEFQTDKEWEK